MNKFTKQEIEIARGINRIYKYIARDRDGFLTLFSSKPKKYMNTWQVDLLYTDRQNYCDFPFDDLFQSIKWEDKEPTLISDIYNFGHISKIENILISTVLNETNIDKEDVKIFGGNHNNGISMPYPDGNNGGISINIDYPYCASLENGKIYTLKQIGYMEDQ